jgi:RNA polymerase sigma factor (sigma-70 family)
VLRESDDFKLPPAVSHDTPALTTVPPVGDAVPSRFADQDAGGPSTQELLDLFERTGAPQPFETIMRRYGGMVYNVCYRVTRDKHDAEDAAQATFLTLAVRARQAKKINYLGPWLQKVGRRVALDLTRSKRRRKNREEKHSQIAEAIARQTSSQQRTGAGAPVLLDELKHVLREELDRLPTKYRMPLVLHYFGGMKPEDIAKELRVKSSTLGVRLHRGRKMLADAMQGRGFTLSVAALGTLLGGLVAESVLGSVVSSSTKIAASVAAGSLTTSATHGVYGASAMSVAPDVFALANTAVRALALGRLKLVAVAALLLGGTIASGQSYMPAALDALRQINLPSVRPLIDPLLRLLSPGNGGLPSLPRVDAADLREPDLGSDPTAYRRDALADALDAIRSLPPAVTTEGSIDSVRTATAAGSTTPRSVNVPHPDLPPDFARQLAAATARGPQTAANAAAPAAAPPQAVSPASRLLANNPSGLALVRGDAAFEAGAVRTPSVLVDGDAAHLRITGGQLNTQRLVVGDRQNGRVTQSGGSVDAGEIVLGSRANARGAYQVTGDASVRADQLTVAAAGQGRWTQDAGRTQVDGPLVVGRYAGADGMVELQGGTIQALALDVGRAGTGVFDQAGGALDVRAGYSTYAAADRAAAASLPSSLVPGQLALAADAGGFGGYTLSGGTANVDAFVVGGAGVAMFDQTGGELNVTRFTVGDRSKSRGTVAARGGRLNFVPGTLNDGVLIVGREGDGMLALGNAQGTPYVSDAAADGTPLIVRAKRAGEGTIHGWGRVQLSGAFVQNGRVVADGYGVDRTLDFSSVAGVTNTIDNPLADGLNGWYARDKGMLRLPPLNVQSPGLYTWGENPADPVIDLVNSVRLSVLDLKSPGEATIALLAGDRTDAPAIPDAARTIGLWRMDGAGGLKLGASELLVRVDDAALAASGKGLTDLALWTYDDGDGWTKVKPDDTHVDLARNLLWGPVDGPFSYFAVGVADTGLLPTGMVDIAQLGDPVAMHFDDKLVESLTAARNAANFDAFDAGSVVPEPSTVAGLITLAAGTLLRRRRR